MFEMEHIYRDKVRFIDVDTYKILHHSKYFSIMEEARFDYMKHVIGVDYNQIMNDSIRYLVLSAEVKYIKSAMYGDEITTYMKISIDEAPMMNFRYTLYNQKKEKLLQGIVIVGYYSTTSNKLLYHHPEWLMRKISN